MYGVLPTDSWIASSKCMNLRCQLFILAKIRALSCLGAPVYEFQTMKGQPICWLVLLRICATPQTISVSSQLFTSGDQVEIIA